MIRERKENKKKTALMQGHSPTYIHLQRIPLFENSKFHGLHEANPCPNE